MGLWDTITAGVDRLGDIISGRPVSTPSAGQIIGQAGVTKEEILQGQKDSRERQKTAFLEAQNRIAGRPIPQMASVAGPTAAQIGQVAGPTAATFERTAAPQAATMGQAGQDVRGMQLSGLEALQQRATGAVPTIAEQQLQRGLEQQLAAQAAQANVGGSPLAQRQAQMQGAQAMQQTAGQAALAAQQERMQAEQALLQATQGVRGQDLSRAQTEAQLQQQASLAGADLASREAIQQAQLQQQAGLAGYQGALQQASQQAQLQQQAGLAGYQGALQQAQINAQLQAQQQQTLNALEAQFLSQGFSTEQAQQQALLALRAQNLGIAQGAAGMSTQAEQAARAAAGKAWGGILGGIGSLPMFGEEGGGDKAKQAGQVAALASAASDVKVKTKIKDSKNIQDFLNKMKAKDFDYIKEYGDKGQTGILAQDLMKSKVGKTFVTDYDEKTKGIDVVKSIGPVLASLSHLNEKINKLEGNKKSA